MMIRRVIDKWEENFRQMTKNNENVIFFSHNQWNDAVILVNIKLYWISVPWLLSEKLINLQLPFMQELGKRIISQSVKLCYIMYGRSLSCLNDWYQASHCVVITVLTPSFPWVPFSHEDYSKRTWSRFTTGVSISIHILLKFRFTITLILIQWSLKKIVHGTTALLLMASNGITQSKFPFNLNCRGQ